MTNRGPVVCPIDESPVSKAAATFAFALAKQHDAEVHLLQVLRHPRGLIRCSPGSRNRVSLDRTQYQEAQMDKWAYIAAAIPGVGAVAWALVRFFDWRRKLRMREESL